MKSPPVHANPQMPLMGPQSPQRRNSDFSKMKELEFLGLSKSALPSWDDLKAEDFTLVFEGQHGPGVDVEGEMKVDGPGARFLGVEIYLPELAERVRLDEMSFVVHVETVVDGLTLDVGDEPCNVNDCHWRGHYRPGS